MDFFITSFLISVLHLLLHYAAFRMGWTAVTKVLQEPVERIMHKVPISDGGRILFYLLQAANSVIWGTAISIALTLDG